MTEVIHALDPIPTTADSLLALAIQKGASIEQVTQLFDLKLRVDANEARKAFVKAMSGFRSEVKTIGKNGKGHNNARYATLDNVTEAVNPILSDYGLSFCWAVEQANGIITVHCDVTHTEGHSQRTTLSAAPDASGSKNAVQAVGSTVTYLQRYTLNAALGLATGVEDDDAKGSRGEPEVPTITVEQSAILKDLVERTGYDTKMMLARCEAPSIDQIHPSKYEWALNALTKKLEKMGAAK